jgi:hypothetical protein
MIGKLPVAYFAIIERKDKAYAAFSNDGNHTGDCIFSGHEHYSVIFYIQEVY